MKKYRITLTENERAVLEAKLAKGKVAARKLTYARIMLKADRCSTAGQVAEGLRADAPERPAFLALAEHRIGRVVDNLPNRLRQRR